MIKRTFLLLLLTGVLIFACACGEATGAPVAIATETPSATPDVTPEPVLPTEEPVFNPDFIVPDSSVRPVAAMIDNQGNRVLPQGGISQAQIIYEILVEYNITRYMALFWGTLPDMVGPIRSSRHYFLDYVLEHDAIYTHAGGSTYAYKDIPKLKIQNIDYQVHGSAFWDLTTDKSNWQDSYTSKERLEKFISDKKYRTEPNKPFPFTYHDQFTIPENGNKAEDISIKFATSKGSSTCGFIYDSEEKLYKRLRMGDPHMERNTNEQVKTTNIIVIQISSPLIEGDTYGRRNLKNIGSGEGFYITGGKSVPIKWSKTARDAQTEYKTEDGKPLTLNRGQTWIEIVPNLDYVTIK
ncbi:MAG: DUF3048 domain-containing protein [Clostridiaceae bacterium]|jgi:hypothetical protein|nr:DUF3048 domain-containing protein [Clostridiaceae bacterium]